MKAPLKTAGVSLLAAAMLVVATGLLVTALIIALVPVVGSALAFALVGLVIAAFGGGLWVATVEQRQPPPPPPAPTLEGAVANLLVAAIAAYARQPRGGSGANRSQPASGSKR